MNARKDLVDTRAEVIKNIYRLYKYAISNEESERTFARERLTQGKWYLVEKIGGELLFGPSRFSGYKENTIEKYEEARGDGTETNKNYEAKNLYKKVAGSKQGKELQEKLNQFLTNLGMENYEAKGFFIPAELSVEDVQRESQCFYISPTHCKGYKAEAWKSFKKNEIAAIGWENKDYTEYTPEELEQEYKGDPAAIRAFREFKQIKSGDIICCTNNFHGLWGIGIATSSYFYNENLHDAGKDDEQNDSYYSHCVKVAWLKEKKDTYITRAELGSKGEEKYWPPYGTIIRYEAPQNYIKNYLLTKNPHTMELNLIEKHIEILHQKQQLILQGAPGTGKTYIAKNIAEKMIFGEISTDKQQQAQKLAASPQFKIVQFHPSYTYEDFVRGIVVETENDTPRYTTKNKILGEFAETALKNYQDANKEKNDLTKERKNEMILQKFRQIVEEAVENSEKEEYPLKGKSTAVIKEISDVGFRYTTPSAGGFSTASFNNLLIIMNNSDNQLTNDSIRQISEKFKLGIKSHHTYYRLIIERIREEVKDKDIEPDTTNELLDYVLVIDEINRANLSCVLGELIYALEYRNQPVKSMYKTDIQGDEIILPPNLYIIGTMNTADRSVGQIDYAIRRRFAFIDTLPQFLTHPEFATELFIAVSSLFIDNIEEYEKNSHTTLKKSVWLSEEFRPEDVWLGHSYFIIDKEKGQTKEFRLKYEIIPILKE